MISVVLKRLSYMETSWDTLASVISTVCVPRV